MVGNFSVKRTDGSFNKLPPDQVIEETINKNKKMPRKILALFNHIMAAHISNFKHSLGLKQLERNPKDQREKIIKYAENIVQDC